MALFCEGVCAKHNQEMVGAFGAPLPVVMPALDENNSI
jgi:hypothetical protein